ncbi:demethoxyubiquinone hydroxylase family protein [Parvularcula marina]|uniref:demethoxyubiquinone hydroxylase family protein n=1 Tax=Parvularcula marina TaxID=2292771 RepID=UPI0035148145
MSEAQEIIRRILRVNHAGEHGAVAIYSAQLARAKHAYPDLSPWLAETLNHEKEHRQRFFEAMPSRKAKPCRALSVWSIGGKLLGSFTALFGRSGIYICTAAVERTVHQHLEEQSEFLRRIDTPLAAIVNDIRAQEIEHLTYAEDRHNSTSLNARLLSAVIGAATECLILVSTRGDSFRLRSTLRNIQSS